MKIVLIEPKNSGNIGAIARIMDNFGFSELILVAPKCDHLNKEAMDRSCHAKRILKKAKIVDEFDFLEEFDVIIGTTGVMAKDFNITRTPIESIDISKRLSGLKRKNFCIVFGREDSGLHNNELEKMDLVLTIPTSKKYSSINLSHAVGIILYEFSKLGLDKITDHINKPILKEKEVLDSCVKDALDRLDFATSYKKDTSYKVLKRVIIKAIPSKRELIALIGFFKKIK